VDASHEREFTTERSVETSFAAHLACFVVLSLILLMTLLMRCDRPYFVGAQIPVEPDRVARVQQRIDPNRATWAELTRLPGIGEQLSKRIVAYREESCAMLDDEPVFRRLEDLDAVKGIGPKTLERIAPHLLFPQETAETR
jgi:competence ComEA-like helix-hairpin-helix protein